MRSINKIYYFTIRGGILCLLALILGGAFALLAIACDIDNPDGPLNTYICPNGTPAADGRAGSDGDERCAECTDDYILNNATCVVDTTKDADDDGSPDALDVDDDNDGLIEIRNLDMLYHMRYNLAGTTYDDEEAGHWGWRCGQQRRRVPPKRLTIAIP